MTADPFAAVDAGPSGRRAFLRRVVRGAAAVAASIAVRPSTAAAGEGRVFELRIENRAVASAGGAGAAGNVLRVTEGDSVELRWRTDEAVTLHLHGYDLTAAVEPGATAVMRLLARATGRFPVTSHGFDGEREKGAHGHHKALLYLEVHPR